MGHMTSAWQINDMWSIRWCHPNPQISKLKWSESIFQVGTQQNSRACVCIFENENRLVWPWPEMLQNSSQPWLLSEDSHLQRLRRHMSPFNADANTYPNGSDCCPWQPLRFSDDMSAAQPITWCLVLVSKVNFQRIKKGVSPVHAGGSKCVNTDTHGCGDLVWQEYMSFLAGYCEGGYSCWLWFQCKQNVGSVWGRVCESERWALIDLLNQKKTPSPNPNTKATNAVK